jgi:hypothetical protein
MTRLWLACHLLIGFGWRTQPTVAFGRVPGAGCMVPDSVLLRERQAYFTDLLTSSDPDRARVRGAVGLSHVAAVTVQPVTEPGLCQMAARALAQHCQEPDAGQRLWVYDLGANGFGVEAPDLPTAPGEYQPLWLFDREWQYRGTLAGL